MSTFKNMQRGPGKSWSSVNTSRSAQLSSESSLYFSFQDAPASQGGGSYTSRSLPLFYGDIKICDIPAPDTRLIDDRPAPYASKSWIDATQSLVIASLSSQLLAIKAGSATPVLVGIDSKTTVQENSKNFRVLQGKEAVVNSFFTVEDKAIFGVGSVGVASPPSCMIYASDTSRSGINIMVRWSASLPFMGGVTQSAYNWLSSCLDDAFPLVSSATSLHASAVYALQQGDIDLLTSIAEMDKTVSYVVSRLTSIGRIISMVRRKDFSFLKKTKLSVDPYLEARYAIRPLIIDAQNAIKALSNSGALAVLLKRSRRESIDGIRELNETWSEDGLTYTFNGTLALQGFRSGGAIGKLSANLPTLNSLGLFNIATTAVELIPWSFVFQWFVNISGLIAGLNPNPVYELQAGWISVKGSASLVGTLQVSNGADNVTVQISWNRNQYTRTPKRDPAKFAVDVNLSIPKIADLLAFVMR